MPRRLHRLRFISRKLSPVIRVLPTRTSIVGVIAQVSAMLVRSGHAEFAESLSGAATLLVGMGALGIEEIIEARRTLQGGCVGLAVSHANAEHVSSLETALARQQDPAISDEGFCQVDFDFHRALVDAPDNGMLRFVMYTVIEALIPVTNMVVTVVRERATITTLHQRMLDCLEQGDAAGLQARMDELLDYLLESFEKARAERC